MNIQAWFLGAALAVPITLAGQAPQPPNNQPPDDDSVPLSTHDKLFLHTLASEDQSEIDLANLALKKSQDPRIQQYAKSKILAADPAMEQGAKQLAAKHHMPVSSDPSPAQKAQYQNFSSLSGKNFDRAYARYEGKQQAEDLIAVQDEAKSAKDPQVGSYASTEATPVQQAAQAAKQLANSLGTLQK